MLLRSEDRLSDKVLIMKLNCMCQMGRLRSAWECQVRKYVIQKGRKRVGRNWGWSSMGRWL